MSTVGVVGLGTMGSRMATRLVDAGLDVVVHDVDASARDRLVAAGARSAETPRAVADSAAIVLTSLPSAEVSRAVVLGAGGICAGRAVEVCVELSTIGMPAARVLADGLADSGVQLVDAPVSGGPTGAEKGTLTVMVAGATDAVERARPVLEHLGSRQFVVGDRAGQAQVAKLANNLLMAGALTLTGEALTLGVKSGLDPGVLLQVIDASTGQSNAASTKVPQQVLTRQFAHGFALALMTKDVHLCLEHAKAERVPMPLGGTVEQLVELATVTSDDGADCTEVVRMIESWSQVVIEGEPR